MYVFAFDRDRTVDVNAPRNREAVPLEWVRHLAHETPHEVYATGNQMLADEADIPGIPDIVRRHPERTWDVDPDDRRVVDRYDRYPERRDRLRLLSDVHPDADSYYVVDDIDLSDMREEGWNHYYSWDFVPAVKQGDVSVDVPGVVRDTTN